MKKEIKNRSIIINDNIEGVVSISLNDILIEISDGNELQWAILYLDAKGRLGEGKSMVDYADDINDSKNGLIIKWSDLVNLSKKFLQIFDIVIIGSKNKVNLRRYTTDEKMYKSCYYVIEMCDSSYWKIVSYENDFINRLKNKYKLIEEF